MRCGIKCPSWHFSLKLPAGLGPVCLKHMLPLDAARDKCSGISGPGRARKKGRAAEEKAKAAKPVKADAWPGSLRGWGPITKEAGL